MKAKNLFRTAVGACSIVISGFAPFLALAVQTPPTNDPLGYTNLNQYDNLLWAIFSWFFYFIVAASIIALVWAAWTYLTAGDDEQKVSKAKNIIIYAVIALVIAFLANGIPDVIQSFLGV